MTHILAQYDIAVIGSGHAGIEAALAGARMGCTTAVFTINMDSVGNCPCNPSIGGTAKGHLVKEIDALGGEMGKMADECFLQSRMLNLGKGPAVHSLRAQIDRMQYKESSKKRLESHKNIDLKQAEIISIEPSDNAWEIKTRTGLTYTSKTVIIASGTYLCGKIHMGEVSYSSGPDGIFPAFYLSDSLKKLGINLKRFKTGTPARVLKSSINFDVLEEQPGDEQITPFSQDNYKKRKTMKNQVKCYITWTNEKTKSIILENLKRSPVYNGKIEGTGPRYCPSIEDKIVRFPDKERHQIFIEPCGKNTQEMYVQGLSTSLPEDVQLQVYCSVKGLENVKIMRPAYAIEYDLADPTQLYATLEFKDHPGLYGAGQFNGSSGYEEAAAQGLIAGINAALKVQKKESFVLDRGSSYIGTLIDDLVTKGVNDPYRMMTSRSEYRLILRQDNADERLTPRAKELGLIEDCRWSEFLKNQELKTTELKRIATTVLPPSKGLNDMLVSRETSPLVSGVKISELLKRPQITYKDLEPFDITCPHIDEEILGRVQTEVKYQGYIERQNRQIEEMRRLEKKIIPRDMDFNAIKGLRLEAREKLTKIKPFNLGQASRISGVSPADISVLMIWLSAWDKSKKEDKK